jgi:hypothetical protein
VDVVLALGEDKICEWLGHYAKQKEHRDREMAEAERKRKRG